MSVAPTVHPLTAFGWNERAAALFEPHAVAGLVPGRVLIEHRGRYTVAGPDGEVEAGVSGRFRHHARTAEEFPAVGDWVGYAVGAGEGDGRAVIQAVLPRHSRFARPVRGDIPGAQVVAANVDVVLIVGALDRDFNLRRLERYLALAWSSGAEPVILLNKADACDDVAGRLAACAAVAPGVTILALSATRGDGLDALRHLLQPGRTLALLGSSGVGKSTIVNALVGSQRQDTREVRADDQRGRHTTTVRELLQTDTGALLIDSPGMRSVGMWEAEAGLESAFADVEEIAARCRFSDCSHSAEPRCAVRAAIADGSLAAERLHNLEKLERELAAVERRRASEARAERRRQSRMISRSVRDHMRRKYGTDA